MKSNSYFFYSFILLIIHYQGISQATIKEEERVFKTYEFSDPDPIPILSENPKIYPYFKYEGYTHTPKDSLWKVVTLENEYIQVSVLPQVGGKVWGAIEKSTGEEFIYRNEVMKFRNISMRGPWTSGGIEFNFGIIGHHPSTATAVDYLTQENQDGSVSCFVGNIDLPSRTQWRVEIRLPADAAYFETRVLWYNPTAQDQSYYNWMTAAAEARDDLVFYCPGDEYLDHPGMNHPWPMDSSGRDLSKYSENNFGSSKSYHVVGVYDDFFGGYYTDKDFGFGHWAPYEEMPGQKLWLWAQSRSGAIWEDLLTDDDGQYIEFQAGRLFNQYSPGVVPNPITQAVFEPGGTDLWREIWFPVKEIGGLTEVSPKGILHLVEQQDSFMVGINALEPGAGVVEVLGPEGELIEQVSFDLKPMDVLTFKLPKTERIHSIQCPALDLVYDRDGTKQIDRPFQMTAPDTEASLFSTENLLRSAREHLKFRSYQLADQMIDSILLVEPGHLDALIAKSELLQRGGLHNQAYETALSALQIDTYHPRANFVAAQCANSLGRELDALEYLGWAARSLAFRAEAYAQISVLYLRQHKYQQALRYARNTLDFNKFHLKARQVLAVVSRLTQNTRSAVRQHQAIAAIDPLNHFPAMEMYLMTRDESAKSTYLAKHRSEFSDQTMMELALLYHSFGLKSEALEVLDLAPQTALVDLWWCFLAKDSQSDQAAKYLAGVKNLDIRYQFPYRVESLPVLKWAAGENNDWQIKYLLALNYWALGRVDEAGELLNAMTPDIDDQVLYLTRASLNQQLGRSTLDDLRRAVLIDKKDWRAWRELMAGLTREATTQEALTAALEAFEIFPNNYSIGMALADLLVQAGQYEHAITTLQGLNVLPFEGASKGRTLWAHAHLGAALAKITQGKNDVALSLLEQGKEWPENLGVGQPYDPDLRRFNYLHAYLRKSDKRSRQKLLQDVFRQTLTQKKQDDLDQVLALLAVRRFDSGRDMEVFLENQDRETMIGQWMLAMVDRDLQAIADIESQGGVLFSGLNYELLKQIALLQ